MPASLSRNVNRRMTLRTRTVGISPAARRRHRARRTAWAVLAKWAVWQLFTYVAPCIAVAQVVGGDLSAKVGPMDTPAVVLAAAAGALAFVLHRLRSWWVGGPEASYGRG